VTETDRRKNKGGKIGKEGKSEKKREKKILTIILKDKRSNDRETRK